MELKKINRILKDNDFIHTSGTDEEMKVAQYLKACCEEMGVQANLLPFPVAMADVKSASLTVNGKEIPCKGYKLCGSGEVEAPFLYLPNTDRVSLDKVQGKIVMIDTGMTHFLYQDLLKNGAVGFITYDGNFAYADEDIDAKELRPYVSLGKKILGVNVNAKYAKKIVESAPETVKIAVEQDEFDGESHNVEAVIPGETEQSVILSAHYDTTPLSRGSYDNLTGCITLLCVMEDILKHGKPHYTVRFLFCGSEERGLLGSKAYTNEKGEQLKDYVLNINLDMVGTVMGKFIACVSAEDKLVSYIEYMAAELGWGINARTGVYSSDSTPFADHGVPALSFARLAPSSQATIHNRYDTPAVLSAKQIRKDAAFVSAFTRRMAYAAVCPVGRTIPDRVKTELDEYLNRKRKQA